MIWKGERAFSHYSNWECVKAGFWTGEHCGCQHPENSADVLETTAFMKSMEMLLLLWPVSTAVHLTNSGINRRAWLGQAACFVETGNCSRCTVEAWLGMDSTSQKIANELANEVTLRWLRTNSEGESFRNQRKQLELRF